MTTSAVFNTERPISEQGKDTYRAIAERLANLDPPISIDQHIAQTKTPKGNFSTLRAHDSTLDGIEFVASNAKRLAGAFDIAKDASGARALVGMKEDPDHWALKASFGKTVGTGWREVWQLQALPTLAGIPDDTSPRGSLFRMRFGTAGTPLRFTALHCAVDQISGKCNVHIDESGFVLETSQGVSLTPDLYDHFVNELLLKTEFRDWLAGKMPNESAREFVREVIGRTTLHFPNASNGYAGLNSRLGSMSVPQTPWQGLQTIARIAKPVGLSFDLYDRRSMKAQVTGSLEGGQRTITLTLGAEW